MKRILVLVVGLVLSGMAWSESWVGVNATALEQDNRFYYGEKKRLETDEVFFRLGADMNHIFGSELRAGASVEPTEEFGFSFEHDYIYGAYLRVQHEMGAFSPYLIAGLTRGQESLKTPSGASASRKFDDVSGGVGLDITFGDHLGLNAEFMRYYAIGNVTLRGPSAGVFWQF